MNLLFFFQFFLGHFDDCMLSINVCTICCFDLGFRNARQAFRGYGETIKDMSHTQDVSSRVLCKYPLFQNLLLEFFSTYYLPMTLISVSLCSFYPTTKILKPILSDLVLFLSRNHCLYEENRELGLECGYRNGAFKISYNNF